MSPRPVIPSQGGVCPEGSYCPTRSSNHILCDPGKYCPTQMLPLPYKNCSAGFYCWLGAKSPQPDDDITGNRCPEGSYCLGGSQNFTLCPPGTYSNTTNNTMLSDCQDCPAGYYCAGYGNANPTDKCNARYYCPGKQSRPDPPSYVCGAGHFCPQGSQNEKPCSPGQYQDQTGQLDCKVFFFKYVVLYISKN